MSPEAKAEGEELSHLPSLSRPTCGIYISQPCHSALREFRGSGFQRENASSRRPSKIPMKLLAVAVDGPLLPPGANSRQEKESPLGLIIKRSRVWLPPWGPGRNAHRPSLMIHGSTAARAPRLRPSGRKAWTALR